VANIHISKVINAIHRIQIVFAYSNGISLPMRNDGYIRLESQMSTQIKDILKSASQIADTGKAQPSSGQSGKQQLAQLVIDIAGSMLSNKADKSSASTGAPASANIQQAGQAGEAATQNADAPARDDKAAICKLMQDVIKQLRSENEADSKTKIAESRQDASAAQAELDSVDDPANEASSGATQPFIPPQMHSISVPKKQAEPMECKEDLEAMHTISMHMDKMPKKMKGDDLQKKIDDKETPPDLKEALIHVRDNKALKDKLDTAGKGGDADGCISKKDLNKTFEDPRLVEYSKKQADNYAKNYVPSDAKKASEAMPSNIDSADAAREMYLYSDSLPKHIDMQTMQDIVDGKRPNDKGKMPPQMVAAAQYYTKHPEEFKKAFGGDSNNRDYAQDSLLRQVRLSKDDTKAMDTMLNNKDVFFKDGGKMNRDKLEGIAKDEKQKPEVRDAAKQLLNDPLLYGMLDNGKKGHGTNLVTNNNDGLISSDDVDAAKSKLSEKNTSKAPAPTNAHKPKTAEEAEAAKDMANGMIDDPNIKDKEGGGLKEFGIGLGKGFSKFLDVAKGVLDFVGGLKIPGISQIALGASAGVAAANDLGLKPALERTEKGTSVKESELNGAKKFGIDMAATGASALLPGAGAAVSGGLAAGGKAAATSAVEAAGLGGAAAAVKGGVASVASAAASGATAAKSLAASAAEAIGAGGAKTAGVEVAETGAKTVGAEAAEAGAKTAGAEAAGTGGTKGFFESVKDGASAKRNAYLDLANAGAGDIVKGSAAPIATNQTLFGGAAEAAKAAGKYKDHKTADDRHDANLEEQRAAAPNLFEAEDDVAKSERA
jgi:type III secretion translocon protein HrpF